MPFNNYFYCPIILTFIYFDYTLLYHNLKRFILLESVYTIVWVFKFHVCLFLILFWWLPYWEWPMNVTLGNVLSHTRLILYNFFLMCDLKDFIYECFSHANVLYESVHAVWVTYVCIRSFWIAKTLFMLVYSWYFFVCHQQWNLEWLWNFITMLIWKSCIIFVEFLLVLNF